MSSGGRLIKTLLRTRISAKQFFSSSIGSVNIQESTPVAERLQSRSNAACRISGLLKSLFIPAHPPDELMAVGTPHSPAKGRRPPHSCYTPDELMAVGTPHSPAKGHRPLHSCLTLT